MTDGRHPVRGEVPEYLAIGDTVDWFDPLSQQWRRGRVTAYSTRGLYTAEFENGMEVMGPYHGFVKVITAKSMGYGLLKPEHRNTDFQLVLAPGVLRDRILAFLEQNGASLMHLPTAAEIAGEDLPTYTCGYGSPRYAADATAGGTGVPGE